MWTITTGIVLAITCVVPICAERDCFTGVVVATAPNGSPLVVSPKQLARMAVHLVMPEMPAGCGERNCHITGTVTLSLLVGEDGRVECIRLERGHPLLVGVSMDAARQWVFRPAKRRGRPASFLGRLAFGFSTGDRKVILVENDHVGAARPPMMCVCPLTASVPRR